MAERLDRDPIRPEDERFHAFPADEWYWTETSWWAFWVPERRLSGSIYNLWRPAMGLVSTQIYVWDDSSDQRVEALYFRPLWHVKIGEHDDPTNFNLASGLSCERIEPLKQHRLRYEDAHRLSFDLLAEGVQPAHSIPTNWGSGPNAAYDTGHYDQLIRVTGELAVWGERMDVDCLAIRDRSWAPRSELGTGGSASPTGYTYAAASPDLAFHVLAPGRDPRAVPPDEQPAIDGYIVRDGVMGTVTGGRRVVTARDRGRPTALFVELEDDLGRTLRAEGECVNHFPFDGSPFMCAWFGLSQWTFDDGSQGWGEDQDCWHNADWREQVLWPSQRIQKPSMRAAEGRG